MPFSSRFVLGLPKLQYLYLLIAGTQLDVISKFFVFLCERLLPQMSHDVSWILLSFMLMKLVIGSEAPRLSDSGCCLIERIWAKPSTKGSQRDAFMKSKIKKVGFLPGVFFASRIGQHQ